MKKKYKIFFKKYKIGERNDRENYKNNDNEKNDIWRTEYLKGERNGKGKEYYYNDYYNDLLKIFEG